ncbi:MAG TPA: hypothetical protein PK435_14500, partial [Thermoanaerobaculaceae bacterium]|nr:hypothetical protein [Thermoanaerobaculaceae bacterium]
MRPGWRLAAAAAPGLALAFAAVLGWAPAAGDLPSYFVPLRQRTAAVVTGARGPFWDPDAGCGEPFFANPQSALLYPPAWLAAVLPARAAVGVEVGLHLALLAVGCALLARRLGAAGWLDVAAGWSVLAAGPVLDAVGVLNNLESLAWMPWVWGAALAGSVPATAGFLALAYLAAEPSLALVAGLVALVLAPRRRTLAALALAVAIVAVQALPFAAWVRGGDRGPGVDQELGVVGAVLPAELVAMVAPGAPLPSYTGIHFVSHFAVPLWALALGLVAAFDRRAAVRRLALSGWVLVLASVLPELPAGAAVWHALTAGFVRYSGRLLFPAVVALVPAAAAAVGTRRARPWLAAGLAALVAAGGLALGGAPWPTATGAVTAAAVLAAACPAPAAVIGAAAVAWRTHDALGLREVRPVRPALCLAAQREARRVYVVAPSAQQLAFVQNDEWRLRSLALGYGALSDGRRTARTYAPLTSRRLAAQLGEADRGPAGRWWLNALGADRIVAQHPIPGFPELCREGGLLVYGNPEAWPEAAVVCAMPQPGQVPRPCGQVRPIATGDDARRWRVEVGAAGGVFLWLETPDPGWEIRVDGAPARAVTGAGILHGVEVAAGDHLVSARYRPPGLIAGAAVS